MYTCVFQNVTYAGFQSFNIRAGTQNANQGPFLLQIPITNVGFGLRMGWGTPRPGILRPITNIETLTKNQV